jgi:hypothetical protein
MAERIGAAMAERIGAARAEILGAAMAERIGAATIEGAGKGMVEEAKVVGTTITIKVGTHPKSKPSRMIIPESIKYGFQLDLICKFC